MNIDNCFKEVILTEPQLKDLCKEWRNILRLNQWFINVRLCKQKCFINDNCDGEVEKVLASSKATIKILASEDYKDNYPQDMEKILVHELLHLAFDTFEPNGELKYALMEGVIERLAIVLVDLKRGNSPNLLSSNGEYLAS